MSQTIRRKGAPVRKVAAQQKTARKVRNAKARTGSMVDSAMAMLPLSEDQWHRVFLFGILAVAAVTVVSVARVAGLPDLAAQQIALAAEQSGFAVEKVEVRGVKHLNELKVYERVEGDIGKPMPEVDVDAIRAQLVQLSWVEDARVSRQLPNKLVIDVVERTPHAVLRKPGRLVLIDATGVELEPVAPARAKGKLVVSGPGAGKQVGALTALLDAAPALRPQVAEAEWVGNRRWNLTFSSGQILMLPEGSDLSAKSLMSFAQLDGRNRLLGGKATAFDMRVPDRIYMRVPDRASDQAAADAARKAEAAKLALAENVDAKPELKDSANDSGKPEAKPKSSAAKPAAKSKPETAVKAKPKAREKD